MENNHRCRELGPAKMQKVHNGVDSNDWASALLLWIGLDEAFARAKGRFLRIMFGRLIVKNHVEKGFVDVDATVVIDKAQLAKAIHEEADPGSSRSNHVGKGLLRDFWNSHQWLARPPEFRHQQEDSCQSLFAGIE
jgi:hypothetical protein